MSMTTEERMIWAAAFAQEMSNQDSYDTKNKENQ